MLGKIISKLNSMLLILIVYIGEVPVEELIDYDLFRLFKRLEGRISLRSFTAGLALMSVLIFLAISELA